MCNSQKCAVCECDQASVPLFWKEQKSQDEQEMLQSSYDHRLGFNSAFEKLPLKPMGKRQRDDWCEGDEVNAREEDFIFVNMKENKESYTAYNGSQIWNAIYAENCMMDKFQQFGLDPQETCREETILYQAVSGLHASVNTHISH
mmetsp:Transcript_17641/g.29800  ORF Transcript_17641/g.29800 Transcript_17641/m.29800 type:complete len:145 (+) Transcript_17641:286-720(+)